MMYIFGGAVVYVAGLALFTGLDYIRFDRLDGGDWVVNLFWPIMRPCLWLLALCDWMDSVARPVD